MRRQFPYKRIAGALAVTLASIFLMNLTGKPEDGLSLWGSIFSKASKPVYAIHCALKDRCKDFAANVQDKKDLLAEIEILKREREALLALRLKCEEQRLENERLNELLGVKTVQEGECKVAKVIGRQPSKWFSTITIDLGTQDGVELGASVLEIGGLVGRVFKAGDTASDVLLLTDPDSGVGAILQRSRDQGLILGGGGSQDLTLRLFSKDCDVEEGDVVVTSGMGSKYPPGIAIGEVESVYMPSPGLVKEAKVRPFADLLHLEEVMVVMAQ